MVVQEKAKAALGQKKTKLAIPVHPELKAEMNVWAADAKSPLILQNPTGGAWTKTYSSLCIQNEVESHGLRPGLNIHGLRKLAATRLAEAGCTAHEIAAITGHKTLAMIALYTASVSQERLAEAAILRLSQGVLQNVRDTGKVIKIKR